MEDDARMSAARPTISSRTPITQVTAAQGPIVTSAIPDLATLVGPIDLGGGAPISAQAAQAAETNATTASQTAAVAAQAGGATGGAATGNSQQDNGANGDIVVTARRAPSNADNLNMLAHSNWVTPWLPAVRNGGQQRTISLPVNAASINGSGQIAETNRQAGTRTITTTSEHGISSVAFADGSIINTKYYDSTTGQYLGSDKDGTVESFGLKGGLTSVSYAPVATAWDSAFSSSNNFGFAPYRVGYTPPNWLHNSSNSFNLSSRYSGPLAGGYVSNSQWSGKSSSLIWSNYSSARMGSSSEARANYLGNVSSGVDLTGTSADALEKSGYAAEEFAPFLKGAGIGGTLISGGLTYGKYQTQGYSAQASAAGAFASGATGTSFVAIGGGIGAFFGPADPATVPAGMLIGGIVNWATGASDKAGDAAIKYVNSPPSQPVPRTPLPLDSSGGVN